MSLLLESIAFNHDPGSANADAINLRRNATTFVPVPEWQRGVSAAPEDSVAAYAIDEIQGNTPTIRVRLTRTDPHINEVEVRAVSTEAPTYISGWPVWPFPAWGISYYLYNYYVQLYFWQLAYLWALSTPQAGVLGTVKAKQVLFGANEESTPELFELQDHQLSRQHVGSHKIAWQWQYRPKGNLYWTNFAITRHKIYTLLAIPSDPWQQIPYHPANTQLPWTEVIEYACDWSFGATTPDEAAERITRAVYDLGSSHVRYACDVGGGPQYTDLIYPYFFLSDFLERLANGFGRGWLVNCSDCTAVVSTFANALGCDLWQSRMGTNLLVFAVNPIRTIGSAEWQLPCGWSPGFTMHEVVWKGDCTAEEPIFDPTLEVDGGSDPTVAPHVPLLPVNMVFGHPGDNLYRDRLAAPHSNARQICEARPETRTRRFVI
jgi:hypothetical protein